MKYMQLYLPVYFCYFNSAAYVDPLGEDRTISLVSIQCSGDFSGKVTVIV